MGQDNAGRSARSTAHPLGVTGLSSLLADLVSGNDERAEAAALALPEYGETAFTALQGLLFSKQPDTRWWAVRALAEWQLSDAVIRILVAALEDPSSEVREC